MRNADSPHLIHATPGLSVHVYTANVDKLSKGGDFVFK